MRVGIFLPFSARFSSRRWMRLRGLFVLGSAPDVDDFIFVEMKSSMVRLKCSLYGGRSGGGASSSATVRRGNGSTEDCVSEDWAAVAKAINDRVKELGWRQRELAERSQVSSAIVREIQRNTVNRKRSPRTLESLSITLGWHPDYLDAVLNGRQPLEGNLETPDTAAERLEKRMDSLDSRLSRIKAGLAAVVEQLRELTSRRER